MTPPLCEDAPALVAEVETAVNTGRLDAVQAIIDRTEAAYACGARATAPDLARLFLAEGAWLTLTDQKMDAAIAFSSAHRLDAAVWNAALGPEMRAAYDEAVRTAEEQPGPISVSPPPEGFDAAVDGAVGPLPMAVPAGLHLVQVLEPAGGPARFARVVLQGPGESLVVTSGPLLHLEQEQSRARIRRTALGASIGTAVLAGAGFGLAWHENAGMEAATTLDELDSHYTRQKVYAFSAYGLAGLTAAGVTLQFVL